MESHGPGERTGPAQDRESARAGKGSASRSAVSGRCLWWSPLGAGRGGGMLCGVEVGVEPPALSPESSFYPPGLLGLCATQTVQLSSWPGFAWTLCFFAFRKRAES